MALNACEDYTVLREWAPLSDFFQKLPTKTHNSLFNNNLKLTCVDAIAEYLALGTNSGVVYCYDRKRKDLQRLRCENDKSAITVIKIISSVDYMVACGNKDGNISIFQIPKVPPDNLPASLRPKNKQVERYTVSEMHKGAVSAIEWSKNGMKLFSGDSHGLVVLTEIDFYMHLCKSVEVLDEAYEIVQLSYHQQHLLISTTYRSIICQKQDKWKVSQIGKKDRKVLGNFGGIFYQNGLKPTDVILYCSRPGLRIWVSDIKGTVQQTLLFKDVLKEEFPEVPILNPLSTNLKRLKPSKEALFGYILPFCEEFIITYSSEVVYILNPKELKIVATISHLRGVLDVAVNKGEIFILEGERSLIRVAFTPESMNDDISPIVPSSNAFLPLNTIREITNKIQSTTISAIQPLNEIAKTNVQICDAAAHAEEAQEFPNKLSQTYKALEPTYTDKVYEAYRQLEIYNKIAEQEFDDTILFKHGRRKKTDMTSSVSSISSNSSDERDANITKPTVMNLSTVGILPDLRSPDTIQNEIVQKEKLLADILKFDQIKVDLSQLESNKCDNHVKEIIQDKCDSLALDEIVINDPSLDLKPPQKNIPNNVNNGVMLNGKLVMSNDSMKHGSILVNSKLSQNEKTPEKSNNSAIVNSKLSPHEKTPEKKIKIDQMERSSKLESSGESDVETPVCRVLPESWQVYKLSLQNSIESPDKTLSDWEII